MGSTMSQAICSNCGKIWPSGQTACSCGGTARTYNQTVDIKSSSNVQVFWALSQTAWEKNWPLIVVFVTIQFFLAIVSYWTSGWISVGWSIFGSIVSTALGLLIVVKVVTKTRGAVISALVSCCGLLLATTRTPPRSPVWTIVCVAHSPQARWPDCR
jgi:hypothetical protein